jgi:hypothetical protein
MRQLDAPSDGSVISISRQAAILKIPMNGSYAVPLKVLDPNHIDLITWCFAGFSGRKIVNPSCFLILGGRDEGALSDLSSISIRTHFGDRHSSLTSRLTPLSATESSLIANAFISSLGPMGHPYFNALVPILSAGLDAILANGAPSSLSITRSDSTGTWLADGIDFIPDYAIVRSKVGYACIPIISVRFQAPHRAVITLTADGLFDTQSVSRAILSGHGRYAATCVV